MKYVLNLKSRPYLCGRGVVAHDELDADQQLEAGAILTDGDDAYVLCENINEYLEADVFEIQRYVPDWRTHRHRRPSKRNFYSRHLAKRLLLEEDYAERKLPQILGHNKRPDQLIFMYQLAQRYPRFAAQLKNRYPE